MTGSNGVPTANSSRGPAYEMLPVRTGAARAEAAALAEDTARLLAEQGIHHPAGHLSDLIRSQATVLGLYEDGVLVGCLVVHADPDMRHWGPDGRARGLLVSLVPPVPGRIEQVGRLLSLWLADYTARAALEWVWWEIPAADGSETSTTLLDTVRDLGWEVLPAVRRTDGEQVVRLRLRAEVRNALTAAISPPRTALPTPAVCRR
ncbi:hypothetical protein KBP30_00400 [Streptomyces sp. Go40/10]|uniref:hypothetical protein n=1 Tax=Streptomyces sp. Go40/10 TaxID=2825844 RepID=UPI001E539375|nr:hypothetical protein [Streptomyces sp. Go40/10]UFQ99791.1 hypothetical protein KBP30_00400 [Streptomyces sp. Go40/10]